MAKAKNNDKKYIVVVYPKDEEWVKENIQFCSSRPKDWDGKSPLYYNGRYYGQFSTDIKMAMLYSNKTDALNRLSSIIWDYVYSGKSPFIFGKVAEVQIEICYSGDETVFNFDKEIHKLREKNA